MTRRAFVWASWVPGALWGAALIYIRPYDGWGAWAAAPLLLPSLVASGAWAVGGLGLLGLGVVRNRRVDWPVVGATLLGGVVFAYYMIRYLARPTF